MNEFEAILNKAEKAIGSKEDGERLACEVYYLMKLSEKDGKILSLQQAIFYAKQFEVTQNMRKPFIDPTILTIARMGKGTPISMDSTMEDIESIVQKIKETQNMRMPYINPAMRNIATTGTKLSRVERRRMERMEKKSGSKPATKKHKK